MKNFGFKTEKDVLSLLNKKDNNIKFVRIIFSDVLGREMNFCIPIEKMKSAFAQGVGFDGSSIEGFARVEESDLIIVPDPATFRVLPWDYEQQGIIWQEAVIFGNIYNAQKKHFKGDGRFALKKILEKNKKFGELVVGPEIEFFMFKSHRDVTPLDHGGYFHDGKLGEIRKISQIYLEKIGVKTECDHHEVAAGQHEINLQYRNALEMADSILLAKYIIKRTARKSGFFVSFMPKPITKANGSGMHLHLSLWKEGDNLFFDKKEKYFLSQTAKHYSAGLIKYGREIQLSLNQGVNSYKRLIPDFEAPVYLAWGVKNRSAYIRVPQNSLNKANSSTRIEIRSPDPACNIYLALTMIQAAGMQGIKENLKLAPPQEKDIFKMSSKERKANNIQTLANNLKEAINSFQKSTLAKESLNKPLFEKIIENKKIEWEEYKKAVGNNFKKSVSPYEIEKYLPTL